MNFETIANEYLRELETGSNPCRPSTVKAYRSILNTHLLTRFGNESLESLAKMNNLWLKELVRDLRQRYAPASIQLIALTFRSVLEFPRDENGLPIQSLRWEPQFYDLPAIVPSQQKAPTVTAQEVQTACTDAKHGQLYLLLAASGLRISEALALRREDIAEDGSAICVWQSKTPNGVRTVDLHPEAAAVTAQIVANTEPGERIFPYHVTSIRRNLRVPGFHSLRRFRESVLLRSEYRKILISA